MFFFCYLRIEAKHDRTTAKIGKENKTIRRRNEKKLRIKETLIIEPW